MATFLTVKEASRLTGKSPSSIRRIIYPIIHDDIHPDRPSIQPTVEDAVQLRLKGENFAWRLTEELLRREVPVETSHQKPGPSTAATHSTRNDTELLAVLRRELDIKNQQIAQQGELIAKHVDLIGALNERLREGNILIGSLQQRLALTDGRGNVAPTQAPAKLRRTPPRQPVNGSVTAPKTAKPKKGILARFFG